MTTFQTDSIVDQYFHEIEDSVGLSSEDEVAIAQQIKEGDEEALSDLVKANLRFVVSVAKHHYKCSPLRVTEEVYSYCCHKS